MEEEIRKDTDAASAQPEAAPSAWHKFQRGFLLWFIALFYAVRAFLIASGNIYYEASVRDAVYAGIPLLKALDYVFAAHCALMGAGCIVSVLRMKKHGAGFMLKLYIALAAGEAVYMLLRWAISELPPMNIQGITLLIAHALLWWVNRSYYRKRPQLLNRKEAI